MKKSIKYIIIIVVIGALIGLAGVYYVYNKPQRNINKEKPAFIVDPATMVNEFSVSEDSSTLKYNNKVIQLSGKVLEFSVDSAGASAVFVNSIGGVTCSFDSLYTSTFANKFSTVKPGDNMTLKGRFDGFDMIMGVVLSKCVLVE